MSHPKLASPLVLPESQPYWEAANQGRLIIKRCRDCGRTHHYPRAICPHCLSEQTEWVEAAGTGVVYSFSTMGSGDAAYTIALVTLDEGITMMSHLVDCDITQMGIGHRVRVVFQASEGGQAVPVFTAV